MIDLIAKDLRICAGQRKFRLMQFVAVGVLSLMMLCVAFELLAYAQRGAYIDVGYGLYSILVITLLVVLLCFAVPLQAVEMIQIEKESSNFDLLRLTPFSARRIVAGKFFAATIAAFWTIWLAVPLFWLSLYTGGLTINKILICTLVILASISFFSMIGTCFALFYDADRARTRSYGTILLITLLPLALSQILTMGDALLNMFRILSPLCVLLSIIKSNPDAVFVSIPAWAWMVCLYLILSGLIFCLGTEWGPEVNANS